jgi:fatty acid/phospholipid biosynthesis enzyme
LENFHFFLNLRNFKTFEDEIDAGLYSDLIILGYETTIVKTHKFSDANRFVNSLLLCEKIVEEKMIDIMKKNIT